MTEPNDIIKKVVENDPIDALYEEVTRRTSGALETLSCEELKDLCLCAESLTGVHSKRSADAMLQGLMQQLVPLFAQLAQKDH